MSEFEQIARAYREYGHYLLRMSRVAGQSAQRLNRLAAGSKVLTIILGAVAATHGAATAFLGENNAIALLMYTVVGLIIAAVASVETAFKFEARSASLRILAADIDADAWRLHAKWQGNVTDDTLDDLKVGRAILEEQTRIISDFERKGAELGVNLALELVRARAKGEEKLREGFEGPFSRDARQPPAASDPAPAATRHAFPSATPAAAARTGDETTAAKQPATDGATDADARAASSVRGVD